MRLRDTTLGRAIVRSPDRVTERDQAAGHWSNFFLHIYISWRQFHLPWTVVAGAYTIRCRATDGAGVTQPETRTRPYPDGAEGWHTIEVVAA